MSESKEPPPVNFPITFRSMQTLIVGKRPWGGLSFWLGCGGGNFNSAQTNRHEFRCSPGTFRYPTRARKFHLTGHPEVRVEGNRQKHWFEKNTHFGSIYVKFIPVRYLLWACACSMLWACPCLSALYGASSAVPTWTAISRECLAKTDDDDSLYAFSLVETAKIPMHGWGYLQKGETTEEEKDGGEWPVT